MPQILGAHPFDVLSFRRDDKSVPLSADIERHQQMKIVIGVAGEGQRRETGLADFDAQLLPEFARQRAFGALAGIELAAGKFPQAGKLLAFGTLRDEHTIIRVDQRGGDNQK